MLGDPDCAHTHPHGSRCLLGGHPERHPKGENLALCGRQRGHHRHDVAGIVAHQRKMLGTGLFVDLIGSSAIGAAVRMTRR